MKRKHFDGLFQSPPAKKRCQETTDINSLPEEMLLHVFSYLRTDDLKKSLLVNSRWNQLISQSSNLMNHLPLVVDNDDISLIASSLTRKYRRVKLVDNRSWHQSDLEHLRKIGKSVVELEIIECVFYDDDMTRLLACFPNVEQLHFNWSLKAFSAKQGPIRLNKLHTLTIEGYAWMLNHMICQVQIVSISNLNNDYEEEKTLIKFFNSQGKLQHLKLERIDDLFSLSNLPLVPKFQLRSLYLNSLPFADTNNLLTLIHHPETCQKMTIGIEIDSSIFRHILSNFTKLTSLIIDGDLFSTNPLFFNEFKPNRNLQRLEIDGEVSSKKILMILDHFPCIGYLDISKLKVRTSNGRLWHEISQRLSKLTHLKTMRLNFFNMNTLKIPTLKAIEITSLGWTFAKSWVKLGRQNPNIESIVISSSRNPVFNIRSLRHIKKLRYLEIRNKMRITTDKVRSVIKFIPQLMTFVVSKECWASETTPQNLVEYFDIKDLQILIK